MTADPEREPVRGSTAEQPMDQREVERHLHRLLAKEQIAERLLDYGRAVDRLDYDLIRSVFHVDAIADYGDMYTGSGHGFADFIAEEHPPMTTHTHHLSNISVVVDGDRAGSETYVIVRARTVGDDGKVHDTLSHGRYADRWERRDEPAGPAWRIAHRRYLHSLDALEAVRLQLFPVTGSRDGSDPSYDVLGGGA